MSHSTSYTGGVSETQNLNENGSEAVDKTTCYQCGLPNPPNLDLHLPILGKERYFCCHGCYAVAKTIVETGNEDYYTFRETPDGSQGPVETVPEFIKNLQVYDKPEVQQSFVRSKEDGLQEAYLILEDIRCAACVWLNEQHLRSLEGIHDVSMDYTSHQARVVWDPKVIPLSEILQAIANIGYQAHPFDPVQREKLIAEQKRKSVNKILFSFLLGMEVMAHAIATYWMGGIKADGHLALWEIIGRYTDLIVVTAMLFYSGADFYQSAWRDLKNKQLGMDVPIVLGLTTAYIGSVIATFTQRHEVYFDSIAMFIVLILIARYFELNGRIIAGNSLDRLLKVIPKTAERLTDEGCETVLVTELKHGDLVKLNPGETVPVDGILHQGQSSFDESLLTGEVMPVLHQTGDTLISGSCNVDQPIVMRVERNSNQSTLNDIRTLLDKGIESKPEYAQLAEQAAKWFVLAILLIALATIAIWWQIDPERVLPIVISVLIITCPCALALATPVALSLSSGAFAKMGVLPMNMAAIETLSQADTFIFDKTGTLTQGYPRLKEIVLIDTEETHATDQLKPNTPLSTYLAMAASLEWHSEHPIARSLKNETLLQQCHLNPEHPPFKVKQLVNTPGQGIQGVIEGKHWCIGKIDFCKDPDCPLAPVVEEKLMEARRAGHIVISLCQEGQVEALFILHDELRENGKEMVRQLKQQGIDHLVILSGDHPDSVARIAHELGIETFHGHLQPQDKLRWIQQHQQAGHKVVMVGDGINDAPTLAAADVSISFAEATDLAQMNSDFVLMTSKLDRLPKMRVITLKTRRIILQNLFWAVGYNFTAVPFAALGWIPPWGAALGMSLSSFIVISNSLRLKLLNKEN